MRSPVATGTVVAGFRVESLIGEGAMGSVYLAEETGSGRQVALKVLDPELASDERFRQRFLRESELAAGLHHPNVVATIASGADGGLLYLATTYVEGLDLREALKRDGRLEPERTLNILGQVAAALDAAHAAGLVHRDVKPGNILLGREGELERAYICDFGLARHVTSVSSLTGDRGFVGTIDYVPPEQIEGGALDARADVYSLACVLFECLAGVRPFDRESELAVVFAHLNEPPPRLSDVRPELPVEFDAVLATGLSKAPSDRYSSCGELIDAARAALRGRRFVRRRLRRRRLLLATAAVLVAAGATVGGILASQGAPARARTTTTTVVSLRTDALNLLDARTHRVVARIVSAKQAPFSSGVSDIAFSARSAWVLVGAKQRIVRIDLATRKVNAVIRLPWAPGGVAIGGGSVWVPQDFGPGLVRIDARTGKVSGRFDVSGGEANTDGVAYGDGSLWLSQVTHVVRFDPRTDHIVRRFDARSRYLVFADGAVWAASPGDGQVTKIDPVENRVAADAKLHPWLSDLAVGGGSVWASILPDGVVFRLSEDNLAVQSVPAAGTDPERISFGGGRLWVANTVSRTVSSLDQVSGARRAFTAEAGPTLALYHDGLVWTVAAATPVPLQPISGEEIRVSTPTDTAVEPDPIGGGLEVEQFMYATCSNLLNYPDVSGPAGARLQPEIAAAMPTVSGDGRTYTFHLRSGFRFSPPSNEPVTAETFRHTLERSLSPTNQFSAGPQLLSDISGVAAYRAGRIAHISGITARGNTLSITLVKPAGDFLTRLSTPAFCPVPLSVPIHVSGLDDHPVPSAGPYYVASLQGNRTVLLRNPNYHGNRPRRPARIVFTNDAPTPKAVALANAGALDLLPQDFDNTTPLLLPGGAIDRHSGAKSPAAQAGKQQYFLYEAPLVDYIAFNTRRPLFRSARLRRAVSYALDRRALAASYYDAPADQIVSPAVPGFPVGRDYPLSPDLPMARRLAGARPRHAVLYFCGNPQERAVAQIVRSNLAQIRMSVSIVESPNCPGRWQDGDLLLQSELQSDERDPMPFLEQALSTGVSDSPLGPGPWNNARFRKELEQARPLRGAGRLAAYRRLDDELMRMAPFAVYGTYVWSQYFSPKVGCKVFLGEYGFVDLGALCKKT